MVVSYLALACARPAAELLVPIATSPRDHQRVHTSASTTSCCTSTAEDRMYRLRHCRARRSGADRMSHSRCHVLSRHLVHGQRSGRHCPVGNSPPARCSIRHGTSFRNCRPPDWTGMRCCSSARPCSACWSDCAKPAASARLWMPRSTSTPCRILPRAMRHWGMSCASSPSHPRPGAHAHAAPDGASGRSWHHRARRHMAQRTRTAMPMLRCWHLTVDIGADPQHPNCGPLCSNVSAAGGEHHV